jgi:DnaJ-class molecular chaperone
VCKGTGWKPCGQCDGTGVNQDDLFGGKFLKGDTCWLCSGKAKTMCGNCIDLTDSF